MTTELNAASGAAEQLAPESTTELPDAVDTGVTDDTDANDGDDSADATPVEKTAEQKELERLRRQLTKRDRTQGKLHQELQAERQAREAAERRAQAQTQREAPQDEPQRGDAAAIDPDELERFIDERAKHITRVQQLNAKADSIYEQGASKFPSFAADLRAVAEEVPLFDKSGPTPLMEAILGSGAPSAAAALLHHLGTNPEIAASLEGLTATEITWRLADIKSDMKEAAKPKTSSAPAPLKPVTAAAAPAMPDPKVDLDGWIKARNAQTTKR